MRRWINLLFVLAIFSGFLLGCAASSKDSKIKCVKCGGYFSTQEGAEEFKWMRGY
jgi:hypothetical protein